MKDMLLTLEDAVAICMRFLAETELGDMSKEDWAEYEEYVRGEFEQKCYINTHKNDALKRLHDLTFDINPAEISSQIESDNLRQWCHTIQVEMGMAIIQLPLKE